MNLFIFSFTPDCRRNRGGTVVFRGMLSSTIIALQFVPVFHVITERLNDRWKKRKGHPGAPQDDHEVKK